MNTHYDFRTFKNINFRIFQGKGPIKYLRYYAELCRKIYIGSEKVKKVLYVIFQFLMDWEFTFASHAGTEEK
jgi:hypothetical protein